ncbi:hypothetical protein WA026_021701 [Henosepilachna vigintioctopunctata]|uniref:Rho-GAP domain-containing protein n=1 Tax=Henosepilachna vigintioctopunctata TaxID=420089 RepID=A0AAW1U741_9CUCU
MSITNLTDEELAEKFRQEYSEQFQVLVRMHLSFVLDSNTDDGECPSDKTKLKKWKLVPFGKKCKLVDAVNGAPLTREGICQVYQLIEYLQKEQNIKIEGIFRRTGSLSRQNELKSLLNRGIKIDLESGTFSVHDCASVLKQFLSELPDPLLTECHFPAYCQIAELCGVIQKPTQEEKLLEALQLILLLLPPENKVLLRDILNLLHLTASFESSNKMSADNLATLFTPHLLCPRKLSAEQLHQNSQNLCGIIAFMILHCGAIFKIPQKLLLEFSVKFEKRVLQQNLCLNDSVSDQYAANTVFTFLDHERTAKENEANTTETALAQLYAYIQSLPESSKKRKLVKQFNKENGHGTPLQVLRSSAPRNKSIGDSIKKHILSRKIMRSSKKDGFLHLRSSSEELLSTPSQGILSRARLFCTKCDTSPDNRENSHKKPKLSFNKDENFSEPLTEENQLRKSFSEPNLSNEDLDPFNNLYLTSTPACLPIHSCMESLFTPEECDRKSMSPITRSTHRMTRAMQETMMTPRSRKPVLLVCGNNLANIPKVESTPPLLNDNGINRTTDNINDELNQSSNLVISNDSLTSTFREYLSSRNILACSGSPRDLSFSSRTDDFTSEEFNYLSTDKLNGSLLQCLNGKDMDCSDNGESETEEKVLVLKPKQFDENGKPTVFETSF